MEARELLAKYNIDINDACNGIPLGHPRPHNITHRREFVDGVKDRLVALEKEMIDKGYGHSATRSSIRRELRKIGKEVLDGI
ncbi:MAG: AHH domain-containing protein [Lachnospiraceae bacterium]|nr:AHH domain-containing protein [Lachnospiraceae bacterium]